MWKWILVNSKVLSKAHSLKLQGLFLFYTPQVLLFLPPCLVLTPVMVFPLICHNLMRHSILVKIFYRAGYPAIGGIRSSFKVAPDTKLLQPVYVGHCLSGTYHSCFAISLVPSEAAAMLHSCNTSHCSHVDGVPRGLALTWTWPPCTLPLS